MKRFLILFSLIAFVTLSCAGPNKVGLTRRGNELRQDEFEKDRKECMETANKEESYSKTSGVFDYCMFKKGYEYQPQSKSSYVKKGTADKKATPPPEQLRADLGRIGIVSASFQPEVRFRTPMAKGKAAAVGAARGAEVVVMTGQGCYGAGCAGVLVLGAAVGSIVGAVKGVSSRKIKETEDILNGYLATVNFQETMRELFLTTVAKEHTQYPFLLLEVQGPKELDEEVTYGPLSDKGIDTILEIGMRKCRLWGQKGGINPPLHFLMAVGIKLIRAKDGYVLFSRNFVYDYQNAPLKFSEWGVNNAQPFREELDRGFRYLAMEIVKVLSNIRSS